MARPFLAVGRSPIRRIVAAVAIALTMALSLAAGAGCARKGSAPPESTGETGTTAGTEPPGTSPVGGEAHAGTTGAPGSSTSQPRTSVTDEGSTTTASPVSSTTTTAPGGGSYAAFCTRFREIIVTIKQYTTSPGEPGFEQELAQAKAYFAELAAIAPDPIKADFELINQELARFDPTSTDTAPGAEAAFERIVGWTVTNCGFDPNEV